MTFRLLAASVAAALAGCGGPSHVPVSGSVTHGGKPLAAGSIRFQPAGEGMASAGAIQDGRFTVSDKRPLTPGKYTVTISPAELGSGDDLKTAPPQFTPYSTVAEVPAGGGELKFDVPDKATAPTGTP